MAFVKLAFALLALPLAAEELRLTGLKAPVEVLRDKWGIPHIYAQNQTDLYFAQGYMAVQPRPWLFGDWLDFAEVANTPVTDTNAAHMLALSERVVQWRPVPAVIEPLLRSAVLAQRPDLALAYLERYKAAYPPEYAEWAKLNEKK